MRPLSILDLSPVTTGNTGPQALRNSIDLARHADRLGFTRYWIAEHHSMPNIASSAPEIMIGQIAAATQHLRVGSGGVMLPNHAPLAVAERFKVLEGLFPDRIDLGLGRAPGTDPVTSYALRRRQDDPAGDDFLDRFRELLLFEQRGFPDDHPFRKVIAMPADVDLPPIYLLGSSGYSAQLAAHVGAGFSFAHHFSDFDPTGPMLGYREQFKPSPSRDKPLAILALHIVAADTDAEAERLASSVDLNFARRRQGEYLPIPSPEEAAAYTYTATDRELIGRNRARLVVGTPDKVMAHLEPLVEATKADEVMVTTMIYDHDARKHSYELLAKAFGLRPALRTKGGNLFADLPPALSAEQLDVLFSTPNVKIERIVSHGQTSPEGFWYDQDDNEWVLVVAGAASVVIEGEAEPRALKAGDHLNIPAHTRHRVAWTDPSQPTIWLAVHYK